MKWKPDYPVWVARIATLLMAAALGLAADPSFAKPAPPAIPRTSDGHPSLEGVWASNNYLMLEATSKTPIDLGTLREELEGLNLGEVALQEFGHGTSVLIRVQPRRLPRPE